MAGNPVPFVVDASGAQGAAPEGAVPIALYGAGGGGTVDPIVQALIDAGFGTAGQILTTNGTGDGFEWVDA